MERRGFLGMIGAALASGIFPLADWFRGKPTDPMVCGGDPFSKTLCEPFKDPAPPTFVSLAFHAGEPGGRLVFSDGTAVLLSYAFNAFAIWKSHTSGATSVAGVGVVYRKGFDESAFVAFGESRESVHIKLSSIGELERDDASDATYVLLERGSRERRAANPFEDLDSAHDELCKLGILSPKRLLTTEDFKQAIIDAYL